MCLESWNSCWVTTALMLLICPPWIQKKLQVLLDVPLPSWSRLMLYSRSWRPAVVSAGVSPDVGGSGCQPRKFSIAGSAFYFIFCTLNVSTILNLEDSVNIQYNNVQSHRWVTTCCSYLFQILNICTICSRLFTGESCMAHKCVRTLPHTPDSLLPGQLHYHEPINSDVHF